MMGSENTTKKNGRELVFELNVPISLQDWFKSLPKGGMISIIQKGQEEKDPSHANSPRA